MCLLRPVPANRRCHRCFDVDGPFRAVGPERRVILPLVARLQHGDRKPDVGDTTLARASNPMSRPPARFERIAFVASRAPEAEKARDALVRRYGDADPQAADVIVPLGGDGFMLQTLHQFMSAGKPIYGMH